MSTELTLISGHRYEHTVYRTGGFQVCRISPYDETEYHWAREYSPETWRIYRAGRFVREIAYASPEEAAEACLALDYLHRLQRTGGIN